jgi:hypothetical protein
MWYALTSKPVAVAGALLALAAVSTGQIAGSMPVGSTSVTLHLPAVREPAPKIIREGIPVSYPLVALPSRYRLSERGALRYIAHRLHVQFRFTGPNYAMVGEDIPYGKAVPALSLLRKIGDIPYIQGSIVLRVGKALVVHNAPLPS